MSDDQMAAAKLFDRICKALWGDQYVAAAGHELNVAKNTIGKWRDGKSDVPEGIWMDLANHLQRRAEDLPALAQAAVRAAVAASNSVGPVTRYTD